MNQAMQIATTYLATWNADAADRVEHLNRWADGATYVDPLMAGTGKAQIAAMMNAAVQQFPGHRFDLAGTPDGHGRYVRFGWKLVAPDGQAAAHGMDVVRLDPDGRIEEVVGFLDEASA
ncbi:MAG: nuclear transport factor 2 family protein [Burkholderiaceae bacterium]